MNDLFSSALILRSRSDRSGVSKDAPGGFGDIWSILRDAPAALLRMRAENRIPGGAR
ncbi:hypothetical protein [Bosea sp. ANAM02]|uniref:hypothetical protein n=1 Tax=Bosea sp. ANAM02 TaxID=2020412 RepID=UPI001567159F|nr:hypothetical protein [Bosea sp. ANAM02]